ncbi:hypothetical protein [Flavobacterium sp. DG2-3]|uniref:ATP-binding protein n=1 Tax=Flavobacterium sp. DG2-3 TaxID=3068317 RepID=UPI00273D0ECD|nr:hypothetical protein [Flavobacterium sp. DG2-3]MDP5202418.1 hypothetical protein [Flavobacterium sp. DG2-3]
MKILTSVKILVTIFFLVAVSISCEKKKTAIVKKIDNTAEVKRLTIIADKQFDNVQYDSAYYNYHKILNIADTVKDRVDYVEAIISLGYLHINRGELDESEHITIKAIPHLKYMKKTRFAFNVYMILGFDYIRSDDFEKAHLYFTKAHNLNVSKFRKLESLNCIGDVYFREKKYKKATEIFEKIVNDSFYKKNTEPMYLSDHALAMVNLGTSYQFAKNPKALYYLKKALELRIKAKNRADQAYNYNSLSYYYSDKDLKLSHYYALKAYSIANELDIYPIKYRALGYLINSSTGGDIEKYSQLYTKLIDSINKVKVFGKNQSTYAKYNFNKDKKENLQLKSQKIEHELEMQRQKNRSFISYLIIFVSAMALVFIVFYVIKKGKKESNAEVFKNEMRISEKLQFELEKDIDKILLFSENHNLEKEGNKEEFLSYLNNIYSKTRNISRENSEIAVDENFEKGLKEMISGYTNTNLNIIVNGLNSFSWTKIDRVKKITIFRVVQEVMDQMKTLNNATLASITFEKEEKNIVIMYRDNGTKIAQNYTVLEKRLQNVENRIKTIKGTLNFGTYSESGFKISFKFPI